MIGLEVDGRPLLRAYSIASAHYDDHLEFLSIKIPDGRLTDLITSRAHQRKSFGPRMAPAIVGISIPITYQLPRNAADISSQWSA